MIVPQFGVSNLSILLPCWLTACEGEWGTFEARREVGLCQALAAGISNSLFGFVLWNCSVCIWNMNFSHNIKQLGTRYSRKKKRCERPAQSIYQMHSAEGQSTTAKPTEKDWLHFLYLHLIIFPFVTACFFLLSFTSSFSPSRHAALMNFIASGLNPSLDLPDTWIFSFCVFKIPGMDGNNLGHLAHTQFLLWAAGGATRSALDGKFQFSLLKNRGERVKLPANSFAVDSVRENFTGLKTET